jgi:hypothetical protein
MTWRRFLILLAGLSVESRWAYALRADGKAAEEWVTDPNEIEAVATSW